MIYDNRNRNNLDKLADNTRIKAYQWYNWCIDNKIEILIYETIRTKAQQAENVKNGKSKTMKSYHIVGQALDWVLVDSKGNALWSYYKTSNGLKVINQAKKIGFTSGHDWGWDSPHLQWDKIAYGKDTFGKIKDNGDDLTLSQYNKLLSLIEKQDAKIKELEEKLANKQNLNKSTTPSKWAEEDWKWLRDVVKLTDGSFPQDELTREQLARILRNYDKLKK